jgi:hypothetical protein
MGKRPRPVGGIGRGVSFDGRRVRHRSTGDLSRTLGQMRRPCGQDSGAVSAFHWLSGGPPRRPPDKDTTEPIRRDAMNASNDLIAIKPRPQAAWASAVTRR